MAVTFSIRFVDEDGNGIFNGNVQIYDTGFFGQTYHGYTDGDGWAEFEISNVSSISIGEVSISRGINHLGTVKCDLTFEDGDTASITIPE